MSNLVKWALLPSLVVLAVPPKAVAEPGCTTQEIHVCEDSMMSLQLIMYRPRYAANALDAYLQVGQCWMIPAGAEITIGTGMSDPRVTPPDPPHVMVGALFLPAEDGSMVFAENTTLGWTPWPGGIAFREEGESCSASAWASEMHPGAYEEYEPHDRMVEWNQSAVEWSGPDRQILHIESPDDLIHGDRVYTMMVAASNRMGASRKVEVRAVRVFLWKDHSNIDPELINQITYAPDGCGWSGDDCIGEAWTDLGWGQIPPRLMAFR